MNKRSYLHGIALALMLSMGAQAKMAPTQNNNSNNPPKPSPSLPTDVVIPTSECSRGTARAELDINNVRTLLLNRGDMFWDGASSPRYEVPKVTDPAQPRRHSLFSGAVWVGGIKTGTSQQYVCGITFGQSNQTAYFPGQLDDGTGANNLALTSQSRCNAWNHLFKVNAATVNTFKAYVKELEDAGRNLTQNPLLEEEMDLVDESIRNWPAKGNEFIDPAKYPGLQAQLIYDAARFVDLNKDGIYQPDQGEFPRLPGVTDSVGNQAGADQVVFWITNDAGGKKSNGGVTPPAIGMEIQTEGFAYQASGPLNTMTFYRQKLINKGNVTLDSTYFAQFIDPDLGNANDDYVGCDVERGLGICYNGDNDDEGVSGYGQNPPTIAVDFFRGAVADPNDGIDNDRDCEVDEEGELIMMSSFAKFTNGAGAGVGDPNTPAQFYNFLKGRWGDGLAMTYDYKVGRTPVSTSAPKTKYIFPGSSDLTRGWSIGGTCQNPVLTTGPNFTLSEWSEATVTDNPPGDRRFVSSGGPFTLLPGAVNELTIGVVWAKANSGGALGSYNLLLQSDDIAQKSFDNNFSRLQGPNAPDMEITELDGELIISLTPDEYLGKNTETYQERDPSLKATDGDVYYHFQGYMLYQLANSAVTDLTDPTQARLIMQCDVKDGVSKIINQTYDYTIDALVSQLKVNGENKGIKPYLTVKTDAFTGAKLINHKKYYYHVKAYAYNGNAKNDTKFIEGDMNLGIYSAIPHKVNPEIYGTDIVSKSGYEMPVTRLSGSGNSGNTLALSENDEQEIVKNFHKSELLYQEGGAPVTVKIYDPKSVVSAQYKIEITSRLAYKPVGGEKLQINDTIESSLPASAFSTTSTLVGSLWVTPASASFPQTSGRAVVVREVNTEDSLVNVDVKLLNGDEGGTFIVVGEQRQNKSTSTGNKAGQFAAYTSNKGAFNVRRNNGLITNFATAEEFVSAEYVTFIDLKDNTPIYLKKTLTIGGDELIPNRGLAVSLNDAHSPSQRVYDDYTNGYLATSGLEFPATALYRWLVTIPDATNGGAFQFQRSYNSDVAKDAALLEKITYDDPALIWTKVLDGSFFPYTYANVYSPDAAGGGIAYYDPSSIPDRIFDVLNNRTLYNMGNVDIVFTNDKSKWTRVPVIQVDTGLVKLQNFKSRLRSLNDNFETDLNARSPFDTTQISRGMSWFPGYAIDLDRGIRLNLMFSESSLADRVNGNNLKWEPTSKVALAAAKSFIYVVPTKYDEGKGMEYKLDSVYNVIKNISSPNTARDRAYPVLMKNISWVGVLGLLDNPLVSIDYSRSNPLPNEAKLKLRAKKSYTPYLYDASSNASEKSTRAIPTYSISSQGMEAKRNETQVAKSALDLIRVVPNPYYAYSSYETSQVDNRVKITNLPTKCRIRIYNLGGSLIREYNVDYSSVSGSQQWSQLEYDRPASSLGSNRLTSQDWDLKNQVGIPISSGVYLIHIDAGSLGEKTVKWCGGVRPIDLDALQN
ncbi:hypothetical protein SAMN05421780_10466 [Flexibacter flexilis DSM 6793]|uniref:Uncharacterized protein n=1 Tax=Flexibacter flexilis DSM 6793 TaxID=927664 RepID=A0A1I1HRT3_9BACT|nr:hypothetical protein [Flexibacter flexilis]SFC26576.1 hypothetical protein SAMN05421780_10466 [Flexibacter flexilis DSM 6793]